MGAACDFELNDKCDWYNDPDHDYKWTVQLAESSGGHRPKTDHTTGSEAGRYLSNKGNSHKGEAGIELF